MGGSSFALITLSLNWKYNPQYHCNGVADCIFKSYDEYKRVTDNEVAFP